MASIGIMKNHSLGEEIVKAYRETAIFWALAGERFEVREDAEKTVDQMVEEWLKVWRKEDPLKSLDSK